MSYQFSAPLQEAVFTTLSNDPALQGLVGGAIFDAEPVGALPASYVSLGAETVRDRSDKTGAGAEHDFVVSVITEADGFHAAKVIAAAVNGALVFGGVSLPQGRLVDLQFRRARAARQEAGRIRRIDLTFRARIAA